MSSAAGHSADDDPLVGPLLAQAPIECLPVVELYRHSYRPSPLERQIGGAGARAGGAFFVFAERVGLRVFDEVLDVAYDEILPLDDEEHALLEVALLAYEEHPDVVHDWTERLLWASRGRPGAGPES